MRFEAVYSDILEFEESEQAEGLKIKGTAFRSGPIESKRVFIPSNELRPITESLTGSVILTDHSTSVRDICGRVDESWVDGEKVRFTGIILDDEIGDKIVKGLISKASLGLHVEEMEPFEYQGEEYQLLKGIRARELSLVIYPAVAEAGFTPSFEFSEVTDEDQLIQTELTEIDIDLMSEVLVAHGKVVLNREDYESIQRELQEKRAEYEKISKQLWMLSNCDETFNENTMDKVDTLSLDQIQFLWTTYKDLMTRSEGARGVVADERALNTIDSRKEAVRELIFGVRRDSAPIGKIRNLNDIQL